MGGLNFRKLKADEIDCRIGTASEKGLSLLLYQNARVAMDLLDETVGPLNWKREHRLIGDRLYCTISVYNAEIGQWITKEDVGVESYTEKEKGQASDSFKRSAVNFGIGRELYTAPFIWISSEDCTVFEKNGKWSSYDSFSVKSIGYAEDGTINKLEIYSNKRKKMVFSMGVKIAEKLPAERARKATAPKSVEKADRELLEPAHINAIMAELERTGVNLDGDRGLLRAYNISKLEDMNMSDFKGCMDILQSKPTINKAG